jgi:hypothetical protein
MPETAAQYIERVLGYIEGRDALQVQGATVRKLKKLLRKLTPKQLRWKPEPEKWSIGEILAHLADTEIVASWRMRSVIAANGATIQPFDQEAWAAAFAYGKRGAKQSLETFRVLRENNLAMLKTLKREHWESYGMHLERGKETLPHLTRMFAGHDVNHLMQVERILARLKAIQPTSRAKVARLKGAPAKKKKRK